MKNKDEYLSGIYIKRDKKLKEIKRRRRFIMSTAVPVFAVVAAVSVIGSINSTKAKDKANYGAEAATQQITSNANTAQTTAVNQATGVDTAQGETKNSVITNETESATAQEEFAVAETGASAQQPAASMPLDLTFGSAADYIAFRYNVSNLSDSELAKYLAQNGYASLGSRDEILTLIDSIESTYIKVPDGSTEGISKISVSGNSVIVCFGDAFCIMAALGKGAPDFDSAKYARLGDIIN